MKKNPRPSRKIELRLHRETLRHLAKGDLEQVAGARPKLTLRETLCTQCTDGC